jgi:hypothetical protein
MRRRLFVPILVLAWLLSGCASEPVPTATPTPDPQAIAAEAGAAMGAMDSLHFVFQRDGAPAFVDAEQSLAFRSAEGDYLAPDKMQAIVKVVAGGFVAEVQVISIGEQRWMTNLLTGRWEKMPAGWGLDTAAFFDPEAGIPYLMAHDLVVSKLDGPAEVEDLGGTFWHLSGEVSGEQVAQMSGGLIPPGNVLLDAWIDPETWLIHRVHLLLPDSDPQEPTEWSIEFSKFGQPVEIVAPE